MMKIIAVEEHYNDPQIAKLTTPYMEKTAPFYAKALKNLATMKPPRNLQTLGEGRIADMDHFGIDVQVVSNTNAPQLLPASEQVTLVTEMNDIFAQSVQQFPDRYRALAMLPWGNPDKAGEELERVVKHYGFVGAMIPGRPVKEAVFLDNPRFDPIFATAEKLGVPIYVHPGAPHIDVQKTYYEGFNEAVTGALSVFAWGWHAEAGIQILRMILGGVFERFPNLQVLSGHWGEMVPFWLPRLDKMLPQEVTKLSSTISEIYKKQVFVTPSGMFDAHQFRYTRDVLGADRIIYSVDYPYIQMDGAREFLENSDLSENDRENIAHANAERLFGI